MRSCKPLVRLRQGGRWRLHWTLPGEWHTFTIAGSRLFTGTWLLYSTSAWLGKEEGDGLVLKHARVWENFGHMYAILSYFNAPASRKINKVPVPCNGVTSLINGHAFSSMDAATSDQQQGQTSEYRRDDVDHGRLSVTAACELFQHAHWEPPSAEILYAAIQLTTALQTLDDHPL
jgi:hypothetical protein